MDVYNLFTKIFDNGLPCKDDKPLYYNSVIRTGTFSNTFWIVGKKNPFYKGVRLTINNEKMIGLHLVDKYGDITTDKELGYSHCKFIGYIFDHKVIEKIKEELNRVAVNIKRDEQDI